jgi:hypothetical protein
MEVSRISSLSRASGGELALAAAAASSSLEEPLLRNYAAASQRDMQQARAAASSRGSRRNPIETFLQEARRTLSRRPAEKYEQEMDEF